MTGKLGVPSLSLHTPEQSLVTPWLWSKGASLLRPRSSTATEAQGKQGLCLGGIPAAAAGHAAWSVHMEQLCTPKTRSGELRVPLHPLPPAKLRAWKDGNFCREGLEGPLPASPTSC